ncbi:MAG: DUF1320 family protein [Phycisphaerales bacterium]|nr:DUF1320 family protein [Phycisphaerales bacterium]
MAIITQDDIELVFGETNVAVWSNLKSDSATADTARITWAIASAEAELANRLRTSKYAVPLSPTGSHDYEVKNILAKIAGSLLYESRGIRDVAAGGRAADRVASHKTQAYAAIDMIVGGSRSIPYQLKESRPNAVAAVVV